MDYWVKIFIVSLNDPVHSMISCPLNDLQMGQQVQNPWDCATLRTTSSGVAHPLSTVCKGHYTLWSALPGLPSPNMASLDHSGSRTMSGLWQSTPSDMFRCLASSGQHLVDGEGSSGSSSGSGRIVPHPTQTNHWHGYSSVSLTDWSAAGLTSSGRRIHRTWTPQIFICGDTLRTGCVATTPRLSLTWRQQ